MGLRVLDSRLRGNGAGIYERRKPRSSDRGFRIERVVQRRRRSALELLSERRAVAGGHVNLIVREIHTRRRQPPCCRRAIGRPSGKTTSTLGKTQTDGRRPFGHVTCGYLEDREAALQALLLFQVVSPFGAAGGFLARWCPY